MTMQHPDHPHDERLAALAGHDPEAAADRTLRAHVDTCDRCAGVVDDLSRLRASLAQLPDLVPSRRIQLLPPVEAEAAAATGPFGWLRRLAAPAMAAGAGLVLVGAMGLSGIVQLPQAASPGGLEALDGDAAEAPAEADLDAATPGPLQGPILSSGSYRGLSSASRSAAPTGDTVAEGDGGQSEALESAEPEVAPPAARDEVATFNGIAPASVAWIVVVVLGGVLIVTGLVVRTATRPGGP